MRPQIISFRCKIMNRLGKILSISYNKDVVNQLGNGDPRLMGLIHALQSVKAGEKKRISIPASQAYGLYDPNLLIKVDVKRSASQKPLDLGNQVIYPHSHAKDARIYRVIEKTNAHVILDGNHPFAGIDLIFEVEIVSARKAKLKELLLQNSNWLTEKIH